MDSAIFGQYYPQDSPVHQLDARTKLTLMVVVMVAIFAAGSYAALGVCAIAITAFFLIARIPLSQALRSIGPLFFIVIITALLNLFFVQGGTEYLALGPLHVSYAGVHAAVFLGIRLTLLLLDASLLTLSTTTLDLTAGIEAILEPFKRIGLPAHEFSMVMSIALRFLPQFIDEIHIIRSAQLSRGAKLATSPLKGGFASVTSMMVPLFTSVFRHADTLSAAMDARCYHGAQGRTRLHPLTFGARDITACVTCGALLIVVIAVNILL